MLNSLYRFTAISALCLYSSWGHAGYASIQNFLENSFAATIVLSDSDVFTVGISDFDPNEFLNTDNENWGTEDSIDNRKKYTVSTLPYTFELSDPDAINQHSVLLRLSGMVTEETLQFAADEPKDDFRQVIVDLYAAYRFRHTFNEHWSFEPGFGVHLLRYENTLDYNSPTGKQVAPYLDNLLFNTTAWANVYEPHFKLKYQAEESWGRWNVSSSWHYFYGYGWGDANQGDIGHPEGWYIANTITGVYDFSQVGRSVQSIYSSLRRVDVGSDIQQPLGTSMYYEASVGWLMTPPFEISFIDNIGIGLSLNYGSAFKGGSIVLFFNQD
ncbi:Solitary outer membrane autotransporter beta-barrel domain [Vibrio furnissii]|uniref:Solitary outer membrane autotransporter beta-barrel domain n=1 Tax=Vibrio furnissii TaxID=29494 RepID=UPI003D7CDA96